jgi:hypothetical protein
MDFLDMNTEFGNAHVISYALPRFCHVKTEDFSLVVDADHVRFPLSENSVEFGVVPVSNNLLIMSCFCLYYYLRFSLSLILFHFCSFEIFHTHHIIYLLIKLLL